MMNASHPLQTLWHLAAAPMQVQALQQAVALRLFEQLQQPVSAAVLAQTLALHAEPVAIWLDVLWSMGLLQRHAAADNSPPEYVLSDVAARFFHPASNEYCAAAWQARADFLATFAAQWQAVLQQGITAPDSPQPERWAQAARTHLGQEQRAISAAQMPALLRRLAPLPEHGRFADIGGGPGHVAIALAQLLPGWQGVLIEQQHTASVAQENIAAAGLAQRLVSQSHDLNAGTDIGSGYDLIWCSSVLHFVRQPQAVVQGLHDALRPGGLLLLAHGEMSDDPEQAAQVLPFYAGVMLRGGMLPRHGDIARWMQAAGCTDIRALGRINWALAPLWLHSGRRA